MKVSIIGGGGLVGSSAAFALQLGGVARELALIDVNRELAEGHALDLLHGGPSTAEQRIVAGGYEQIPDSDIICITAGLRRKPDESRLDLINRNTSLFVSILDEIASAGPKPTAVVVVVSNPVDILTYVAAHRLNLPHSQVIGLGTQLDTIRFRSLIAEHLGETPGQISALILGEHGESMVPIWSSATVGGLPLDKHGRWSNADANRLFQRTKGSGAEVIQRKGGAGFAVGVAIRDVIEAVLLDQQILLPVSTVQSGQCYSVRDVAISVPTRLGKSGVMECLEFELWPRETQAIRTSASTVRKTLDTVMAQLR